MRGARFNSLRICTFLLATTALAQPARAQDMSATPAPPDVTWIDQNGVDIRSGQFIYSTTDLSIGSGTSGLQYQRFWSGFGWRHNLGVTMSSSGSIYTVGFGGVSDLFQFSYDNGLPRYDNVSGNGATLTSSTSDGIVSYVYTTGDGTVVNFGVNVNSPATSSLSTIVRPNGEKITIYSKIVTYSTNLKASRVQSAVSNLGWQIKLNYARDDTSSLTNATNLANWNRVIKATAINNAVESCDPLADTCTLTNAWPTSTYSEAASGTNTVLTVTDPIGRQTLYTTNANKQLIGIRLPGATTDTIALDTAYHGRLTSIARGGQSWSYNQTTDVDGNTTMTRTDPLGHTLTVLDEAIVTDELGRQTTIYHDSFYRPYRLIHPEGNEDRATYDARGNVTERRLIAKAGSGLDDIVTTANYDATCSNPKTCNKPNYVIDAKGNRTDYTYDSTHGGILTATRPAPSTGAVRPQVRYGYSQVTSTSGDSVYELTGTSACQTGSSCAGTSDEVKSSISYNASLEPTSVSKGDGTGALTATTAMTYDSVGNVITTDGPLAGTADTTRYRYDAARELVGVVDPDPDGAGAMKNRAVRVGYGSAGQVVKQELGTVADQSDTAWAAFSPAQTVDVVFDAYFRPITSKLSAGGTNYAMTQVNYDLLGRSNCSAIRMNPAIYGSLPSDACTLGTQGSYGPDLISQIVYDNASEPTQLKVAVGTSDAATERALTYNNNGLVNTLSDGENNKTSFVYDGFDRLGQSQYPSTTKGAGTSNSSDYEQLSYDTNGNVTSFRNRAGNSFGFSYDNLDRMTFKDRPGSELDVTYSYDNLGRMTSANQTGTALSFTYDALSRQTSETGQVANVYQQFDLAGRRTQLSTPTYLLNFQRLTTGELKAIVDGSNNVNASFAYDDLRRKTGMWFVDGTSTSWSYDGASRLAGLTHDFSGTANDLTKTFAYNPAGQLISDTRSNDAYAFNGVYSINRPYTSTGLNQYALAGSASFSYDGNGNLTADGSYTRTYDSENQLASASGPTASTLTYDPLGRLASVVTSSSTRRFLYAPGDSGLPEMFSEYDGGGSPVSLFGYGSGPDEPLLWWDVGVALRSLHGDERGSVIAVGDGMGGASAINTYDEYGIPASGNSGRFQYTGQVWLGSIGMQYSKARMFSPTLGRFMQTDPIGYGDGPNWYAYVKNDPINAVDPDGMGGCGPGDICITALLTAASGASGGAAMGNVGALASGDDPIYVIARHIKNAVNKASDQLCNAGNSLEWVADGTGHGAVIVGLIGAGALLGGALTENPVAIGAGTAALAVGGVLGNIAGGAQALGGALQGISGHGFGNLGSAAVSLGLSASVGRVFKSSTPNGWHGQTRLRALQNNQRAGNLVGVTQQFIGRLSPTQVDCNQKN